MRILVMALIPPMIKQIVISESRVCRLILLYMLRCFRGKLCKNMIKYGYIA